LIKNEYQVLVAKCRASGISAKAWCEANSIEYHRYLAWATKINKENSIEPQMWADVTILKRKLS